MATLTQGCGTINVGIGNAGSVRLDSSVAVALSQSVECGKEAHRGEEMKSLEDETEELIGVELPLN